MSGAHSMNIEVKDFSGEGMNRVYENQKWMVGIKNWKPANDISGIDCLERHNETDELFVLLSGQCTLVYANENGQNLDIQALKMELLKVYNIPATLWHNTVTRKDTKLALIEDSSTGSHNSDVLSLTADQMVQVKKLSA
jgi:mannose-6-phosphate isomerase-like protein (cupin superfamily)